MILDGGIELVIQVAFTNNEGQGELLPGNPGGSRSVKEIHRGINNIPGAQPGRARIAANIFHVAATGDQYGRTLFGNRSHSLARHRGENLRLLSEPLTHGVLSGIRRRLLQFQEAWQPHARFGSYNHIGGSS